MIGIINFTGSQGSGKTTMRDELVKQLEGVGYKVLSNYKGVKKSISRDAADEGFVINTETNFESQYYMASKYIGLDILTRKYAKENNYDFIVTDRTVLDVIPYTQASVNIDRSDRAIIEDMLIRHYVRLPSDLIIYSRPIGKLEDDGIRSTNESFAYKIDELFSYLIFDSRLYESKSRLLILEKDSLKNRMKKISAKVTELVNKRYAS